MFGKIVLLALLAVLAWGALARSSSGSGHARVYVVKPADTLWSIAGRYYGGDPREGVWRLQEANGLRGTLLRPGQRLLLP